MTDVELDSETDYQLNKEIEREEQDLEWPDYPYND